MSAIPSSHWLADTSIGPRKDRANPITSPVPLPIALAPAIIGKAFGPCLLWASLEHEPPFWMIGRWNGREWCGDDDWLVCPNAWAPLPGKPSFIDLDPATVIIGERI